VVVVNILEAVVEPLVVVEVTLLDVVEVGTVEGALIVIIFLISS